MVLVILQARMSSSRLPGKVLKTINSKPILEYEIDRIKKSKRIDKLVLATSINEEDDVLEQFSKSIGVDCFRGDLNNVLQRYYDCATHYGANVIVRLTGDCPVIDPEVIDSIIDLHINQGNDYTSNTINRTFPDGLDVEVFNFNVLKDMHLKAVDKEDLEHVTRFIYTNKSDYKCENFENDIDYSYLRWTLDTIDDFYFFKHFYEKRESSVFSRKSLLSQTHDSEKYVIDSNQNIRFAMKKLEEIANSEKESLYVLNGKKVIGTLSTSDVRRALIYDDITNNDQIIKIMNSSFHYLEDNKSYTKKELKELEKYKILPILNKNKELKKFQDIAQLLKNKNQVILMAGGLGSRLKEITSETPKPMLNIGGKPILETIINQFKRSNFNNFHISVNYMSEKIIDYFDNGENFDVNIRYLKETKRMGTAGCISMLEHPPEDPIFVMNADILTNVDFERMLKTHINSKAEITIATINHSYKVPFGVLKCDDDKVVQSILEKPDYEFTVSAGLYIINPDILKEIPSDEYYDITTLFAKLLSSSRKIGIYDINDYWLDIGRPDDFYRAHKEFNNISIQGNK